MKHRPRLGQLLIAGLISLASGLAPAHTDAYLDTQASPHGGQLRMAGNHHLELVITKEARDSRESPLTVYVSDHAGNQVSTAGATGTATLLSGKTKSTIPLTPDGDNRMKGSGRYAAQPDMKVVVNLTLAGQALQARFTPASLAAERQK